MMNLSGPSWKELMLTLHGGDTFRRQTVLLLLDKGGTINKNASYNELRHNQRLATIRARLRDGNAEPCPTERWRR